MITVKGKYHTTHVGDIKFPAGEIGVRVEAGFQEAVKIHAHLKTNDDIMKLLFTVDALRRENPEVKISLYMPYIPYARQDRVCNRGESLSIAVFAKLINSCEFESVTVVDPHSDVSPALIERCKVVDQVEVFRNIQSYWGATVIVAPDAGAYKKCHKFASAVGAKGVLVCHKIRDLKTGRIEKVFTSDEINAGGHYLVLDDICDAGATFLQLVQMFPTTVRLDLAVTHGIFTKGIDQLAKVYDKIHTTTSYHGEVPFTHDQLFWREL
ncbi:Ribose-phosphate pyrophosphokinase [compost metagenome]